VNSTLSFVADAEAALVLADSEDQKTREAAMQRLMHAVERLARSVAAGEAQWDEARTWAAKHTKLAVSAIRSLTEWSAGTAGLFYGGGEEEAEWALARRSRFELFRDLFAGTEAEEWLAPLTSEEVEQDYREQAEQCGLDLPDWVPRSHTWWLWRNR
jgi:cytochrome c556